MGVIIGAIVAAVSSSAFAIAMAAISIVMTLTAKKPQMPNSARGQAERKQVLRSSSAPTTWIYGSTISSGLLTFAEEEVGGWQDENTNPEENQGFVEWLHMVITLADHPIDRIGRIWLNDDLIETFGGNAAYELMNNRTTASPYLLENCPSWKSDMIGRGLAALRVSMLFSQKKYPAGIPNIKCEIWGRKVYDPRDRVMKWSDNATLIALDFVRNHPKFRIPDERIDWDRCKESANICDEIVTRPDGKLEKRYTISVAFDLSERPSAVLDDMLLAMAGELTRIGGKIGIMAGAYYGGSSVVVSSKDIIGNVSITPEAARRDRINTVNGTFVDPAQLFIETDYPRVQVQEWVIADGEELKDDLKLRFVTSDYQAQRLANIQMRRKRLGRTLKFKMNMRGYAIRAGMYVQLKVPEWDIDQEVRVVDWGFDPSDASTEITVRQDGVAIWDDAVGKPMERPPLTSLPSGIPAPADIAYRTEVIGEVVQGVLTWRNTAQVSYTNVIVKRAQKMVYTAQEMRTIHRVQGLPVGDYSAELIAIGLNGGQSSVSTIAFSIQLPPNVIGCDIRAGNWEIGLTPKLATANVYGTQFEYFYYRSKLPVNEVEAKAQLLGSGTQLTHNGLQPDTINYYWIRAINAYGKGALFALEAKTTKDVNSVLDIISGQIGAEDLIEELRKPLENTIDMWTAKVGNTDIGKYGGIGLTIEKDPDGKWRTKCIVDAEVFAILDPSGATGAGSRHPFIVKDGVVYMNKLLLDNAEIGEVIAKYINVQHLVGTLIEGGSFRGGDLWIGENPNGPWSGYGKKWNAAINGAGDGYFQNLTGRNCNLTGTVNANAGTMNNITIAENCNVLGTIYANNLVGNITTMYSIPVSGNPVGRYVDIPASNKSRTLQIMPVKALLTIQIPSPTNQRSTTLYANCSIFNSEIASASSQAFWSGIGGSGELIQQSSPHTGNTYGALHVIPANTALRITITAGGNGAIISGSTSIGLPLVVSG